jgi:Zn-dependent protease/predicted transcriptional regulator
MQPPSGVKIGSLRGIPIYLHASWFLIFFLIVLSLASQFRSEHPQWSSTQQWTLGVLASVLFFASVVFHEMGHSVVALHYRIPVLSITLFIFGGLARIGREPESAKQEFNIAVAGPLASFALAGGFYLLERSLMTGSMLFAAAQLLAATNFVLGLFNLVPAFPLDGGRILRAIAWGLSGDFSKATRFAARGGQMLAYLMILIGIWEALNHNLVRGIWMAFIGFFLLSAAQESYAQVAIRSSLQGILAGDVMSQELPTVQRSASLEDYVHDVLRTGRRFHLVMNGDDLVGVITLHAASGFPHEEWANTSVQAAMMPREKIHWALPEEPVTSLLERMQKEDINQMPVMRDGHVVGLISRDTILRVLQTRLQVSHLVEQ